MDNKVQGTNDYGKRVDTAKKTEQPSGRKLKPTRRDCPSIFNGLGQDTVLLAIIYQHG